MGGLLALPSPVWVKPRVKARQFYKRVVLLFLRPPRPFWAEMFMNAKWAVKPLSFDGRYWVETTFKHGAIQTRVVREGYPKRDLQDGEANQHKDLPVHLMSQGMHVVEFRVHNRMATPLTGRLKAGITVIAGLYLLWWSVSGMDWYYQLPSLVVALSWAKVTLKGGLGNTGVAKQLAGVTSPFILTPYQLVRHIERRKELAVASEWSE